MNKHITLKLLSVIGIVLGLGSTLLSDYTNKKEQESVIDEKINKAFAKKNDEES